MKLDESTMLYLNAYFMHKNDPKVTPYLSLICDECEQVAEDCDYPHILNSEGQVLIGCEGFFHINPTVLGLHAPEWQRG